MRSIGREDCTASISNLHNFHYFCSKENRNNAAETSSPRSVLGCDDNRFERLIRIKNTFSTPIQMAIKRREYYHPIPNMISPISIVLHNIMQSMCTFYGQYGMNILLNWTIRYRYLICTEHDISIIYYEPWLIKRLEQYNILHFGKIIISWMFVRTNKQFSFLIVPWLLH